MHVISLELSFPFDKFNNRAPSHSQNLQKILMLNTLMESELNIFIISIIQQLLECDKCRNSYHPECLGPNHPTRPTKKKRVWVLTHSQSQMSVTSVIFLLHSPIIIFPSATDLHQVCVLQELWSHQTREGLGCPVVT